MYKHKLLVIVAPTASGKTEVSFDIARKHSGEIICADSRTVYKELNIGTAKPEYKTKNSESRTRSRLDFVLVEEVPHYLLDVVDPEDEFSVADFQRMVYEIVPGIHQRGRLPMLVGGTGLYVSAVVDGLSFPVDTATDPKIRDQLEERKLEDLVQDLGELDPDSLDTVDQKNKRRVVRALEVCIVTGQAFSKQKENNPPEWDILQVGIRWPREELYAMINQRVDQMIADGLVEEVRGLGEKYGWEIPAMTGIGYRQVGMHIRGELSLEQAVELLKRDTRRYAKRQLTWFGRDERIRWVAADKVEEEVADWIE